jgi:flagellar basal body-associated protein FliL
VSTVTLEPDLELEPPAKKRWKLYLAVLLAVIAGGAAAAFFLLGGDGADEEVEVVEGEIVQLEPQTTTLGAGPAVHARVAIAVVLAEGVAVEVVAPRAPLLRDALLRELASMDSETLRTVEGSDLLRQRLTADAQEIWDEGEVVRIVLTELVVT